MLLNHIDLFGPISIKINLVSICYALTSTLCGTEPCHLLFLLIVLPGLVHHKLSVQLGPHDPVHRLTFSLTVSHVVD